MRVQFGPGAFPKFSHLRNNDAFEHEDERQTPNADVFLGLKRQAESYYPFGISPTRTNYRSRLIRGRRVLVANRHGWVRRTDSLNLNDR
jgi:hypothetical protein